MLQLRGVPVDAQFEWTLRAPGYAAVSGDRSDLGASTTTTTTSHVHLLKGWANRFYARSAQGLPLAAVEVWLDDRRAGQTDRQGRLQVFAEQRPQRVDFRRADLQLSGGDLFMSDHKFEDLIWGVTGVLRPRIPSITPSKIR